MDTFELIQVRSNAHFEEEFAKIRTTVAQKESEHNWQPMQDALKRLGGLCLGGANKVPSFVASIKSIRDAFVNAISTERTQLSGTAIEVVETMSRMMGKEFAPLLDILIPPVVRLCGRTNKLFVRRAVRCLQQSIQHTQLPEFLPQLAEGQQSQSKILRRSVMECVVVLVQHVPRGAMQPAHINQLESVLRAGFVDADVDTRGESRKAYDQYAKIYEERVTEFIGTLEPRAQKMLGGGAGAGKAAPTVSKPRAGAPGATRQAIRQQMLQQRRKLAQQQQSSVEDPLGAIEIYTSPAPDATAATTTDTKSDQTTKAAPPASCNQNGPSVHRSTHEDDEGDQAKDGHNGHYTNGNGHAPAGNGTTNGTTNGANDAATSGNAPTMNSASNMEQAQPMTAVVGPTPPSSSGSTTANDENAGAAKPMDIKSNEPAAAATADTVSAPGQTSAPAQKGTTANTRPLVKRGTTATSNRITKRVSGATTRTVGKRTSTSSTTSLSTVATTRRLAASLTRPLRANITAKPASTTAGKPASNTARVRRLSLATRSAARARLGITSNNAIVKKPAIATSSTTSTVKRFASRPMRPQSTVKTPKNTGNNAKSISGTNGLLGSAVRIPIASRARGQGGVTKSSPPTAKASIVKRVVTATTARTHSKLPKPQRILRPNATTSRHTERRLANTTAR